MSLVLIVLTSLSACVTNSGFDVPSQEPADVEDRIIIDGEALPLPDEDLISAEPLSSDVPMSPVVRSLLAQSRDQRRVGKWDRAAMLLERALRIEPRNAEVWSRLANIRFDQQSWSKAIQLAAKSNTLARNNVDLKRRNWILMANAYDEMGDSQSAQRIYDRLNQ
jgi:tetratricopeptide (TPR) repeat protein